MKDAFCATCSIIATLFAKQREMEVSHASVEDEDKEEEPRRAARLHKAEVELRDLLRECRGDEWENALDFMARLNLSEDLMRGTVLAKLPIYVFTERCDFELYSEALTQWPVYGSPEEGDYKLADYKVFNKICRPSPLSVIIEKPINWWFNCEEVEFLEYHHPEICGDIPGRQSSWIDPEKLRKMWKITPKELLKLVREENPSAYILNKNTGLLRVSAEYVEHYGLKDVLFKRREVELYGYKKSKSKAQQRKDEDIERIANWMKKIKEKCRRIFDYQLAEVIHWALSTPRPYLLDAKKYNWIKPRTADLFDGKHSVDWIRKRIRKIKKDKVREMDQSAH
ncbi:MAG: hypothetical protein ACLP5H_34190 [Desulfomonilaceae bacterium]